MIFQQVWELLNSFTNILVIFFSFCKANITGIALATAKIFNASERKKRLKYVNDFIDCHTKEIMSIDLIKGEYKFKINTDNLKAGVYFYQIGNKAEDKGKIIILE